MTPTPHQIATQAAEAIRLNNEMVRGGYDTPHTTESIILSAAAKMVRGSGAEHALLLASLNYKRTNHSNPDMMMDDEHEAWGACDKALSSLRSLTELGEGKP